MNNSDVIVVQTDDTSCSSPSSPVVAVRSKTVALATNNSHNSSDMIINTSKEMDDDNDDDDDEDESFEAINHKAAANNQIYNSKIATTNSQSSNTASVVCPTITVHAGPPPKRYMAVKRTSAPTAIKSSNQVKPVKPPSRKLHDDFDESTDSEDEYDEEYDEDEDSAPKRRSMRQVKKPRILEEFLTENSPSIVSTPPSNNLQSATTSAAAGTSSNNLPSSTESTRQPFKQIARKSTMPQVSSRISTLKSTMTTTTPTMTMTTTGTSTTNKPTIVAMNGNKQLRHKLVMCRPLVASKGTICCPPVKDASTQVDLGDVQASHTIVPLPVPVHIPMPMCMYQAPMPVPLLIPVPVAVPVFIPTTKKTFDRVQRKIKKLREKLPSDPYEFELLLYAERLAREEGIPGFEDSSDGESSNEDSPKHHKKNKQINRSTISEPMDTSSSLKSNDGLIQHDQQNQLAYVSTTTAPIEYSNSNHLQMSESDNQHQLLIQPPVGYFKWNLGVKAFSSWLPTKLERLKQQNAAAGSTFPNDLLKLKNSELNVLMSEFVNEVRKVNGEMYAPESIYYICLGIQYYLQEKGQRCENMFLDMSGHLFEEFQEQFDRVVPLRYTIRIDAEGQIVSKIDEEVMWESKQLGVHSPAVLLNTILYFNTKFFFLDKVDAHKKLSFVNVKRHSKRNVGPNGEDYGRSSFLRYYPDFQGLEQVIYEQGENYDNPTRCPVELYNFYLSKCPESVKNRNDVFYLMPEKASLPNSPVWFSNQPVSDRQLERMLNRIKMVKEVNELLLAAAPATTSVIIQ